MSRLEGQLIGEKSEMKVALNLIDNGCRVAYTHGHSHPYDLIADKENLLKIQVKTAKHLRTRKYDIDLSDPEKYTEDNVDLFAGYASKEDEVFYIPYSEIEDCSSVTFTPPGDMTEWNRQNANLAKNYTFEKARKRSQIEQ